MVKVFLSYRREDTAGRAGRLRDSLVARLGASNVFQDVGSVGPGDPFDEAITAALAVSDATLVVIGPDWLAPTGHTDRPRIDDPDDWVHREVVAALASGRPVVPVLVGGAALPPADALPPDLRPLTGRQAFVLNDEDWHHDLDGLLARLDDTSPKANRRAQWTWLTAGGLLAAAAATGAALLTGNPGGSDGSPLPSCPAEDSTWTDLDISGSAPVLDDVNEIGGNVLLYTLKAARTRPLDDGHRVVLTVEVINRSEPIDTTTDDNWYLSDADFQRLVVGGTPEEQGSDCLGPYNGDPSLLPGQRASVEIGYTTALDPITGLTLETDSSRPLLVTPAGSNAIHWRLVIDQTDPSVNCPLTLTNNITGETITTGDVSGPRASFQVRGDPDQWDVTGPDSCLWHEEPGAGDAVLPFTRALGYGDTDAFDIDGPITVAIEDPAGQATCVVTLHDLADGRSLGQSTLTPTIADAATLDPGDTTRVYLSTTYCSLRIQAAS